MRFDDSLKTVLASDMAPGVGARSAWRQLVDLVGRGRVPADDAVLARLRELRGSVPQPVRAATARALSHARPDAALVRFFAEDSHDVAAALLRDAVLDEGQWAQMVPALSPALRGLLRGRRDLPEAAVRALAAFEPADFALEAPVASPIGADAELATLLEPAALDEQPPSTVIDSSGPDDFVPLGEVAMKLPLAAAAMGRREAAMPDFPIPELVARIEAFRHARPDVRTAARADAFSFAADQAGTVVAVHGATPGALVGLSLSHAAAQGAGQFDAAVGGAFRRRSSFADQRLEVGGESDAAGSWRVSGSPRFDQATGRFSGYTGHARRPRTDEVATPARQVRADSLRQLVHELRTPANAITGFAQLIEAELMGPVPPAQRRVAASIRARADDLLAAIEDLDTAARLDGGVLEARPGAVVLGPLLAEVLEELAPLAASRSAQALLDGPGGDATVLADELLLRRLASRLVATALAAAAPGEQLLVRVQRDERAARVVVAGPSGWAGLDQDALLSLEADGAVEGAPLLGTGFCLRLARNLAVELGGSLAIDAHGATLRLPAVQAATQQGDRDRFSAPA